ncbi:MAG: phosphatase PAP2 family protein [Deltaproteobacteria bacterium]|nr:phosphatase PAP2 family protein [Deltaproteobacteria bacterium]
MPAPLPPRALLLLALLAASPLPARAEEEAAPATATAPCAVEPGGSETEAATPDAWQRLSRHGAWKVAGFTFSFSVISFASDWDRESSDWARENQPLGRLSEVGSQAPTYVLAGSALTLGGLSLWDREARRPGHRRALESFVVSQLINAGLTDLLKVSVGRPRPDSGHRSSFPSGHTSSAAAWATLLWRRYGWRAGLPATLLTLLVGASRIQDGRHYLSDVLAGAVLGVSVTYVVDELFGP